MLNICISQHARQRMQQRGILSSDLAFLLGFADREVPIGDNCLALSVSRKALKEMGREAKRCENIVAIVRDDWETIVSVLHAAGKKGTHYKRCCKSASF